MKTSFVCALTELAENDKNVILITGDLGFGAFESFEEKFPLQYFNVGIAEQSMIGIASGLAKAGKKVFVYSIGNFITLRCLEQIRNDAIYHELNVNLVCQGGGFTYGALGMTHHATEDLAIMRALPEICIVAPSNSIHAKQAVKSLCEMKGTTYLRLEKESNMIATSDNFLLGEPVYIEEDSDFLIIAIGGIVSEALEAKRILEDSVKISILDFHTLRPFDELYVINILKKYKVVITLEEHQGNGGLGSIISEILVDAEISLRLKRFSICNKLISDVGSQDYLRKSNFLDAGSVVEFIKKELSID